MDALDYLILYHAGWWTFATAIAFAAATVLWKKGSSELAGKIPGMETLSVRFAGAGALWFSTLLLFGTVRPDVLKPHKNVMLIYAKPEARMAGVGGESIEVKNLDVDFSGNVTYELIRRDGIFGLRPSDEGTLELTDAIPAGSYELRITDTDPRKGANAKYKFISVKVPRDVRISPI